MLDLKDVTEVRVLHEIELKNKEELELKKYEKECKGYIEEALSKPEASETSSARKVG